MFAILSCQNHDALLKIIYSCVTLERSELEMGELCLVWISWVWRVDWYSDLGRIFQCHAAILAKYQHLRNFGAKQASDSGLVSSMGKSEEASR